MSPTEIAAAAPDAGGRLTGLHVLAMLTAFFGVMFVANGFLVYYALGTFPGTATGSSYQASQAYNIYIAAARAQQLRDWHVAAQTTRAPDGTVNVRVDARDADNNPLSDVDFSVTLQRPTTRSQDRSVPVAADLDHPGIFTGHLIGVAAGQWDVVISADTLAAEKAAAPGDTDDVGSSHFHPHIFESINRVVFR